MDVPTATVSRPLPRSAPREQGVDAAGVLAFVDALAAAPAIEPHSLVVVRHGHVVAEGWWSPYAPDGLQLLYSLSKSFTSSGVGLAVAEGLLSLDDTVLSHFPELDADVTDPRMRGLLVRHVAAMAAGHVEEALDAARDADPDDLVRGFLLTPPEQEPGTVFAYSQPCTYVLAAIVARRSGQTLLDYLRPRLLEPLGITDVAWTRDAAGRDLGYSGLHATTDAIARLGLLYLQRGEWEGHRLLPAEWVAEATRSHVSTGTDPASDWAQGYGFQFWQARHGYRGDGAFGQFCLVLPERDAVVAITAGTEEMQRVLDLAWEHLLPALGGAGRAAGGAAGRDGAAVAAPGAQDAAAGDAAAADAALADRLGRLELPRVEGAPGPAGPDAGAWDGVVATAVEGPVASATVDRAGDGWRLTVVGRAAADAGTPLVADLGTAGWAVARCTTPDGDLPLAVSGAWTAEGTLRADLVFLETPHRLGLTLTADGTLTTRWQTEPFGPPPLTHLRAPRR